jgi:hypothetical protein
MLDGLWLLHDTYAAVFGRVRDRDWAAIEASSGACVRIKATKQKAGSRLNDKSTTHEHAAQLFDLATKKRSKAVVFSDLVHGVNDHVKFRCGLLLLLLLTRPPRHYSQTPVGQPARHGPVPFAEPGHRGAH